WHRAEGYRRQFALLLGQKNQLWWDLPARDSLELNGKIYGIPRERFERTILELTELLSVRDKLDVMVRELSLGERMKMELVAALLHQPKVLLLDEPTIGLDVVSQKTVRDFLRQHNAAQRTTILLTSHYMADISELCRRVIIIDHGTIFFDGQLSEVLDRFADFKLVTIACAADANTSDERLAHYGEVVERNPVSIKLKVKRDRVIPVCKALLDELPVRDIDIQEGGWKIASSPQPSPRTLTPALAHRMGEGDFADVLPVRSPRFMGSKRESSFGGILSRGGGEGEEPPAPRHVEDSSSEDRPLVHGNEFRPS
ncbi:MAG: ATP-binding cassette domain-containing protein, partial [Verrucomicrobia bacterium]|nr:ATP-binding cassette domain-containing protein [Verrucomicrobiota bacterium]